MTCSIRSTFGMESHSGIYPCRCERKKCSHHIIISTPITETKNKQNIDFKKRKRQLYHATCAKVESMHISYSSKGTNKAKQTKKRVRLRSNLYLTRWHSIINERL